MLPILIVVISCLQFGLSSQIHFDCKPHEVKNLLNIDKNCDTQIIQTQECNGYCKSATYHDGRRFKSIGTCCKMETIEYGNTIIQCTKKPNTHNNHHRYLIKDFTKSWTYYERSNENLAHYQGYFNITYAKRVTCACQLNYP